MAWILAVDDEEGIRNLIQNALEKDGHRVSVCKNTGYHDAGNRRHHLVQKDQTVCGLPDFISDSKSGGKKYHGRAWFRWR